MVIITALDIREVEEKIAFVREDGEERRRLERGGKVGEKLLVHGPQLRRRRELDDGSGGGGRGGK